MFRRVPLLLLVAFVCIVAGCNVPVPPGTSEGGSATPCDVTATSVASLRSAAGRTGAGDVCMAKGNYTVSSPVPVASGVRLHGAGVTLTYNGSRASSGLFNTNATHDVVVDGFTLDGANQVAVGFRSQNGARNVEARNLTVRNMGEGGVQFQKSDHVVAVGNKISNAGSTMGWGSGIGLWWGGEGSSSSYDSAPGFHAVIANNAISDITDGSSYLTDGNGIIVDGGGAVYPILVTGNVIHDVRGRGVTSIYNSGELWVVHNTVVNASNKDKCDYASYSLQGFTGKARWINNISQPGCGPNYAQYNNSTGYSWTRSINSNTKNTGLAPSAEVKVANPSLDTSTYTLRSGSPATGAAVDATSLMGGELLNTGRAYVPTHGNIGAR